MKIAYVTADFGVPVLGTKGASAHVRGLVHALQRQDHDVLVLAANLGDGSAEMATFPLQELPFGASLAKLYDALRQEEVCQGTRLAKDLRNLLYALSLEVQGRLVLERYGPDVIYERYCLFSTAGLELSRYFHVPLILEVNAPLVLEQQKMRGISLPLVAHAAERLVLTQADHVVVVSDWLRDYVIAQGVSPDRASVIPNAADPELFCPRRESSALRESLGWPNEFVIGFVGSMKNWHGVSSLLELMGLLGGTGSRFRLLLVGDGPERPALEQEIDRLGFASSVHMTGAVPHEDVPALIGAMDIAVAPYAAEADSYFSPVKLFEYMAMACPVVAARVGQCGEVIEHGRTGWLYSPGDVEELAALIRMVSSDPGMAKQVGTAARDCVALQYTWDSNGRRVTEIARSLIDRRLRPASGRVPDVSQAIPMESENVDGGQVAV